MGDFLSEGIKAICEQGKARSADPVYQARAAEIERQIKKSQGGEALGSRQRALEASRIPESTWPFLDQPGRTDAIRSVEKFIATDPRTSRLLVLAGPRGRGKTVALAWGAVVRRGRYMTAQQLTRLSNFDRDAWDELAALSFLSLDELSSELGNPAFDANLFELLDGRYRRCRRTLLATNLPSDAFRARYCQGGLERLQDRLLAGGTWVNLPGPSMRSEGHP